MLNSKKDYGPRVSPSEITQISFSLMPTPILNQTIKSVPINEKMHKKYRKKWKYFSRILLRRFTVYFSKELYRVSLPVIQLQNYYIKCKFERWKLRFKWSRMAHKIHRIYYIKIINERRLKYIEKKGRKLTSNQIKWRTMSRLLITSEIRSKLYLERSLLIKERRMLLISKWKELCIKFRPKNLQSIQKSFIEKRHLKYIYRKYFIRWILKCRGQEDSIGYIFKVEYPEVFLHMHLNMSFDLGSYSCPYSQNDITQSISLLKDVYDFDQMLFSQELENLSDLFSLDDLDNTSSVKNAFINSFSTILLCKPIELPKVIIPTIFDDFDDMQSHLFSNDECLNLSVSSSLSYFQSCPQFLIKDDVNPDVSFSFDELSKDSLKPLDNYKEKDRPAAEPSNLNMNIPLNLSNLPDKYTRSLSLFQVKPSIKEQKTNVNFEFNLNEVKDRINHSPLLNFKHYIKKQPNPTIESDLSLTFKNISDQNKSNNAFANFKAKELRNPSDKIGHIYHNFNDFDNSVIKSHKSKNIDRDLVCQIDTDLNLFGNLKGFTYVNVPNTSKGSGNYIDIVFIDDIIPYQQAILAMSSIDNFERPSGKQKDDVNKVINSKNIGDITPIDDSSIKDMSADVKPIYDIKKKVIPSSDDDITIDIEIDLDDQVSSVRPNLEKVNSFEKSKPKDQLPQDIDKILSIKKSSFPVFPFDPHLSLLTDKLINLGPVEQKAESFFSFDEKDLLLTPDYTLIGKQPESVIQRLDDTGPVLKYLLDVSIGEEYEKDIQIEEEEEEINDLFEEEEEEAIDIDSIDFSCVNTLYLDIPTDIFNSINKSTNSLDNTYLLQRESNEMNHDEYIKSSLNSSRLLEKSRYVPYIFQLASIIIDPLYRSQLNQRKSCDNSSELIIRKVIKSTSSLMSKVRYTPSFLNMYSPLIDNIIRLTHSDHREQQNRNNLSFDIKPKVIHTKNFMANVTNSVTPISFYTKQMLEVQQLDLIIAKGFHLPKVRYSPHIFTYASSILDVLDSFQCKKVNIQSIKPRFINVSNKIKNKNNNIISKSNNAKTKKKICRKIKSRTQDDVDINEVTLKENQVVSKSSSKRTVRKTTEKIVFSPMSKIIDDDLKDDDLDLERNTENPKSKSTNTSFLKVKSNSKKTKRRAASARFKRQKLPDGTTMTIRKIVIEADDTYDENEGGQSNINIESNRDEKIVFKTRKRKRRGHSVNHENNSPKKHDQK